MKKALLIISSVLALFILGACASTPEEPAATATPEPAPKEDPQMRRDLPDWFMMPPVAEDAIYGLGMAKMSSDSLSRDTAIARARKDIAFQVSTRVQASMSDYAQESGVDGNTQVINFVESVSKQVADVELRNAVTEQVYPAVDGTWYAMVSYPKSNITDEVEQIFSRNEDAAFAEFKADEALRRLEADLEANPLQSSVKPE